LIAELADIPVDIAPIFKFQASAILKVYE